METFIHIEPEVELDNYPSSHLVIHSDKPVNSVIHLDSQRTIGEVCNHSTVTASYRSSKQSTHGAIIQMNMSTGQ